MPLGAFILELKRRNVFRVALVYAGVAWLMLQLADVITEPLGLPEWFVTLVLTLFALGFPLALIIAWVFDITPEGIERTPSPAHEESSLSLGYWLSHWAQAATIVALVSIVGYLYVDRLKLQHQFQENGGEVVTDREASIAVLPFVDMSEKGGNQYLGDGIAEELLNALVAINDLKVASRTSSFSFRNDNAKVGEIGTTLGVRHVLEGSVRRAGERLRVTAQLIDVQTGFHLFSKQFDHESNDLFEIQNQIALEIVGALRPSLGLNKTERLVARTTINPQAHELRMKARYAFFNPSHGRLDNALNHLHAALELDPEYWAAHGDLAFIYGWRSFYFPHVVELISAERHSTITLEHEPNNVPALVMKAALAGIVEFNSDKAEKLYRQLLAMPGDHVFMFLPYTNLHLRPHGRFDEAIRVLEEAERNNPRATDVKLALMQAYYNAGRQIDTRQKLDEVSRMTENVPVVDSLDGLLLVKEGDGAAALATAKKAGEKYGFSSPYLIGLYVQSYLLLGEPDKARAFLDDVIAARQKGTHITAADIALGFVAFGDYDAANHWLAMALAYREVKLLFYIGFLRTDPTFSQNPEFHRLLEHMDISPPAAVPQVSEAR